MSLSSGTVSLFSSVAIGLVGAAACAWILKNPDDVRAFIQTAYPTATAAADRPAQARLSTSAATGAYSPDARAGDVTLRAGPHGHFETPAEVNGRDIDVMVDTGASIVALTYEDAERAGLYPRPADFTHQVSTANGVARVAPIMIDEIRIGSISVRNVPGTISERGKLHQTLLGMTFLSRLSRVDMRSGRLVLNE